MPPTPTSTPTTVPGEVHDFDITVDLAGRGTVLVDGQPVEHVTAMNLLVTPGEVTQLHLGLAGGAHLAGTAHIATVAMTGDTTAMADAVRALDPEAVQALVVPQMRLSRDPAAAYLEAIASLLEQADGSDG